MYPLAKTEGWFITVTVAMNSSTTFEGLAASQITSPLAMSFLPTPRMFIPTLSPATASCNCSWCISMLLTSPSIPFPVLPGNTMTFWPTFMIPVSIFPTGTVPIPVIS